MFSVTSPHSKYSTMSPVKLHDDEHSRRRPAEINGLRPSPLKINRDSHFIHKSSSSSSSSSNATTISGASRTQHERQPVIIYTQSPKIIHTQARDFMALVQKLTGLSRFDDNETAPPPKPPRQPISKTSSSGAMRSVSSHDDNESTSVISDENCGGGGDVQVNSSSFSPIFNPPLIPCFADIPLFTPSPNTTNFFWRYPGDPMVASPNMGGQISPSLMEFMKGIPEC